MRAFIVFILALSAAVVAPGCSRNRQYEVRGQVLAIDARRQEVTIKHEDIRGFMPAMTMPFKVREAQLLEGRVPGEIVRATLVVETNAAYLSRIEHTGEAPLTDRAPAARVDILQAGDEAPDLAFVDTAAGQRRLSEWRGRAVAVTFVYTRCPMPDFCPLLDRNFAAVQELVKREPALADRVRLLSVSFDPEFDTAAVLREHAARVHADAALWVFATGERADIHRFASQFGVSLLRGDAASNEIVHNLRTAVIDPAGRITTILSGNEWTPVELFEALRAAAAPADAP